MKWISLHIYYTGNNIALLKDCIIPLIDEQGNINNYFYILYSELGQHIRLRLKPCHDNNEVLILATVKIRQYLADNPSPVDVYRDNTFYPNDSIQPIPYEPEIQRYGGQYGIEVAEEQFRYSTDIALAYCQLLKTDSYNSKLNAAFKLHLATAFIYCNGNLEQSILLFNYLYSLVFLFKDNGFIRSYPDHDIAYNALYLKQKHIFIPFVKTIWNALNSGTCEDVLISRGLEADNLVKSALQTLLKANKLELSGIFENNPLWTILQSYMHMTNNRLGITPVDEPLIYYYIMKSLEQI